MLCELPDILPAVQIKAGSEPRCQRAMRWFCFVSTCATEGRNGAFPSQRCHVLCGCRPSGIPDAPIRTPKLIAVERRAFLSSRYIQPMTLVYATGNFANLTFFLHLAISNLQTCTASAKRPVCEAAEPAAHLSGERVTQKTVSKLLHIEFVQVSK